jgi:hypothetical protein
MLVHTLEPLGFDLAEATDGEQALQQAAALRPDLILMDTRMAGMGGLMATRALRALRETAHIPILAISADAMESDRAACLAAGADACLAKPIRLYELLAQMGTLLGLSWVYERERVN